MKQIITNPVSESPRTSGGSHASSGTPSSKHASLPPGLKLSAVLGSSLTDGLSPSSQHKHLSGGGGGGSSGNSLIQKRLSNSSVTSSPRAGGATDASKRSSMPNIPLNLPNSWTSVEPSSSQPKRVDSRGDRSDARPRVDSRERDGGGSNSPSSAQARPSPRDELGDHKYEQWAKQQPSFNGKSQHQLTLDDVDFSAMDPSELVIDESSELGEGYFGVVKLGKWDLLRVACKQMKEGDSSFKYELQALKALRHPNIVQLLGYDKSRHVLIMEYMEGGSVYNVLHKQRGTKMLAAVRFKIAFDTCQGLSYLHKKLFLHRDITSGNVLLFHSLVDPHIDTHNLVRDLRQHKPLTKVSDFGLARLGTGKNPEYASFNSGNLFYAAPEVLREQIHSPASDVYSFGIFLYELFARKRPFEGLQPMDAAIRASEQNVRPHEPFKGSSSQVPDPVPVVIMELAQKCWAPKHHDRIRLDAALKRLDECLSTFFENVKSFVAFRPERRPQVVLDVLQSVAHFDIHGTCEALAKPTSNQKFTPRSTVMMTQMNECEVVIMYCDEIDIFEIETMRQVLCAAIVRKKRVFFLHNGMFDLSALTANHADPYFNVVQRIMITRAKAEGTDFAWRTKSYEQESVSKQMASVLSSEQGMASKTYVDDAQLAKAAAGYVKKFDGL